jgi:hypothetical protein
MRRFLSLALIAAVLVVIPAGSASASPPDEFDDPNFIVLFADVNIEKSVFINITARDFCDWMAGPPTGPPPAMDPVTIKVKATGNEKDVGKVDQPGLYVEMWEFDPSVDPDDPTTLIGPCEDIQDQLDDPGAQPWATGSVRYQANFNGAFGDRTRGEVTETEGGTAYSYRNTFHINDRCHFDPEAGTPPSCLVDNSKIRAL